MSKSMIIVGFVVAVLIWSFLATLLGTYTYTWIGRVLSSIGGFAIGFYALTKWFEEKHNG